MPAQKYKGSLAQARHPSLYICVSAFVSIARSRFKQGSHIPGRAELRRGQDTGNRCRHLCSHCATGTGAGAQSQPQPTHTIPLCLLRTAVQAASKPSPWTQPAARGVCQSSPLSPPHSALPKRRTASGSLRGTCQTAAPPAPCPSQAAGWWCAGGTCPPPDQNQTLQQQQHSTAVSAAQRVSRAQVQSVLALCKRSYLEPPLPLSLPPPVPSQNRPLILRIQGAGCAWPQAVLPHCRHPPQHTCTYAATRPTPTPQAPTHLAP